LLGKKHRVNQTTCNKISLF